MSEYQYYEFQAVDRPLTEKEISDLRGFSSRAKITMHSFTNEYSWGSFKGDENLWMERYFDGFLYYANWGTHILKLRLPSALLDLKTAQFYCRKHHLSARLNRDKIIIDFLSENEDYDESEDDRQLSSFLPLRSDLSHGDLRCLYLGWLSDLQSDEYDELELEPPVPPGLQNLNPALKELADFLRIDPDLIQAAASASCSLNDQAPNSKDLRTWLATLSVNKKDEILGDILEASMRGDHTPALLQVNHFTQVWHSFQEIPKESKQRTVGQLLRDAEVVRQKRLQVEAEKAAAAIAEQKRLQRIAREKRLNEIMGHESTLWNEIESLTSEKKAKSYDRAIELLTDLRDLADREGSNGFLLKLEALKQRHSAKSSFIKRLQSTFRAD